MSSEIIKTPVETECTCESCVRACSCNPGWFAPGEAELAAEYLKLPFEIFKQNYLIIDSASNKMVNNAPYVWSPRKEFETTDKLERTNYRYDRCVFLTNKNRCLIHKVKPKECKITLCCAEEPKSGDTPRDIIENEYLAAGAPLGMRPNKGKLTIDDIVDFLHTEMIRFGREV